MEDDILKTRTFQTNTASIRYQQKYSMWTEKVEGFDAPHVDLEKETNKNTEVVEYKCQQWHVMIQFYTLQITSLYI